MKIDNQLLLLSQAIRFNDFLKPKNDFVEKEKFLKSYNSGKTYNPQYEYSKIHVDLDDIKKKINNIKTNDKIYVDIKKFLIKKIDFLKKLNEKNNKNNKNTNKNNTSSKNKKNYKNKKNDDKIIYLYGIPNKKLYEKAKKLISKKKSPRQTRNIPAKKVKTIFNDQLRIVNLKGWSVSISKNSVANASVNSSDKKVTLKLRNFSFKEIRTLIDHEIGVHVFRGANGSLQKYGVLGTIGTANYLKTEEGLATLMEELSGDYNPTRFRFFCAREIASFMAQKKSFYEIFKKLHEEYNLSQNNSYLITKRIKRGLKDTSLPGGFIKDHVYFEGREKVINFVKNGGKLIDLYSGRYGIEDLNYLKNKLLPPKYLPILLRNNIFKIF